MSPGSNRQRQLIRLTIVFASYWAAGRLGLAAPFTSENVSPIWPASGVALACLLLFGVRYWPGILVGAFLFNYFSPIPHAAALPIAVGNTASAVFGALLLGRVRFQTSLARLGDVLGLVALGGVLAPVLAASVGVSALFLAGAKPWSSFHVAWLIWWAGDVMGVLIVTPLILTIPTLLNSVRNRLGEAVLLLIMTIAIALLIFDDRLGLRGVSETLGLVVFPFVIWGAVRFQLGGASVTSVIIAGVAVCETARLNGPFAHHGPPTDAILLQVLLALISGTGLIIASIISERVKAEDALVTEQRLHAAKTALDTSEQRFRTMAETSVDAVLTADKNGRITFANRAAEQIFGHRVERMLEQYISELVPGFQQILRDRPGCPDINTQNQQVACAVTELRGMHQSGRLIPLELSIGEVITENDYLLTIQARDITLRKRSERRLATEHAVTRILSQTNDLERASKDVLRGVGECLEWQFGALWIWDQNADLLRCVDTWHSNNTRLEKFESATRSQTFRAGAGLPGRVWSTGFATWIPDVITDANFPRAEVAANDRLHSAFAFPIRVSDRFYGVIEFYSHDIQEPDPELLQMADVLGTLIGQFVHRNESESALHTAERLATAGRLAATIAHEINNPLEAVTNILYLLQSDPSLTNTARSFVETAERELSRASHISRRTLSFYRENSKPSKVSLPELLDGLLDIYGTRLERARVSIVRKYRAQEPVFTIPGELLQVLSNLISNALDAMDDGGTLTVSVHRCHECRNGVRGLRVFIADSGSGLPLANRKRLFQPFFTTKHQTGTGLGLWVVKQIVDKHNWSIRVRNRFGKKTGACFCVFIPVGADQVSVTTTSAAVMRFGTAADPELEPHGL